MKCLTSKVIMAEWYDSSKPWTRGDISFRVSNKLNSKLQYVCKIALLKLFFSRGISINTKGERHTLCTRNQIRREIMLSSMLSTVSSTMSAASTTSVVSTFATVGVSEISVISVICLIALLSASEILSASSHWNKRLSTMLNLAIVPMVLTFFLIVGYKVVAVVGT